MAHRASSAVPYVVAWIALVALTVTSLLFSFAHLGEADLVIALLIATVKTGVVVVVFMHLARERFSVVMAPIVAVFFLVLLVAGVATDVLTRRTFPRAPAPDLDDPPALAD